MNYKDEYVKVDIGGCSLIGVLGTPPVSWGNYFWLCDGPRVINMWLENMEDALEKYLPDEMVKIRNYGEYAIVIDDRIPKEYYYNKCCFTGCRKPSLEIANDIYSLLGDPTNELLQFTDPKKYHELRGETYTVSENGQAVIGIPVKSGSRKIATEWTCEIVQEHCPIISAKSDMQNLLNNDFAEPKIYE